MKNILIPTTFEDDTQYAVNNAVVQSAGAPCRIVLMHPVPMPDSFSAAEFIRKSHNHLNAAQSSVIEKCHKAVAAADGCRLEVRTQIGISGPLLKNLLDFLNVNLIIVPASYKAEKSKLHTRCLEILLKQKCPILQLSPEAAETELINALYIDNKKASLGVQELQQRVSGQFNFRIVSHAEITEAQSPDELASYLSEAVEKNNIDLLIETRKLQNGKKMSKASANMDELLGLPVLSINAEAVKA
ncbi:MAG: hypothetical protein ACO1N9_06290 [Flavobacterium sp.]